MNGHAMTWSLRREFWENRSLYVAPLAVAGVIIAGSLIGGIAIPLRHIPKFDTAPDKLAQPYNLAALMLMATMFIVSIFYCIDALYGERRDRSVLFWKSMPVSDVTTVLSKAAIPLVVLPLLTFVITIATQLFMLLLGTVVVSMMGYSAAPLWTLPWFEMSSMLLYHLITVHALYYAPFFGWLLFVSAWAKRAPFLWAVLPPFAIAIIERIIFGTSRFGLMLASRVSGGDSPDQGSMRGATMMYGHFAPIEFFSKPGLWIGLVITAAFLAGAVVLRRRRDPI